MSVTIENPSASNAERGTPPARRQLSDRAIANLFVLPTILLLVAMNVFPLFWSLFLSFNKYKANAPKIAPVWVGNANYTDILGREEVWKSFQVTAGFVVLAVGLQLLVGFGLALMLNRQFKGKTLVTTLFLLPMMLSSVVVALFWKYLLDPNFGLVNWALSLVGFKEPINWFDKDHALWSVVIADTWQWSPFVMLIAVAGLSSVPHTLYEAASVDRASAWFRFRYITLPFIAPLLMVALLFRTLDSFKMFDIAWILTQGGVGNASETVSIQVYREAMRNWNTGSGCALGYVVLLVIIGLTNLYLLLLGRVKGEATPDATALFAGYGETAFAKTLAGVAPYLALALLAGGLYAVGGLPGLAVGALVFGFCALTFRLPSGVKTVLAYLGLGIGLFFSMAPLLWLIATSFKPFALVNATPPVFFFAPTLESYAELIRPETSSAKAFPGQLLGSLIIGVTSTVLSVGMGTLAAYAFSRFKIKAKNDALFFILSTRMLPPVVVAVPVFLMFRQLDLLNKHAGLILLYTTVNVAFAVWLMKGFTDDVPPEYEEAALLDRYTRLEAFRLTTLPLIVPGMAATAVFCFLNAWNEYALAQLLSTAQPLTAPPSITAVLGGGVVEWQKVAARAVVFLLPAAVFTFLMRNQLLRGMTFGAIKGR
jgi:multiple sugar transport system permease protein